MVAILAILLGVTAVGVTVAIAGSAQGRSQAVDVLRPAQYAAAHLELDAVTAQSELRAYAIARSSAALTALDDALRAVEDDQQAMSRSLEPCPEVIKAAGASQSAVVTTWLEEARALRTRLAGGADGAVAVPDSAFQAIRTGGTDFTSAVDERINAVITQNENLLRAAVAFLALMCLAVAWFVRRALRSAEDRLVTPLGNLRDAMGSQTGGARGTRLTTDSPIGEVRDLTLAYNRLVDQSDQFERAHARTLDLVNAGLALCSNLRGIESIDAALLEAARHTARVLMAERSTVFGRDEGGDWTILWHESTDGHPQIPEVSAAATRQVARDYDRPARRRLAVIQTSTEDPGDEMHLPMLQKLRSLGVRHSLTAPVWYDDWVYGVLSFTRGADPGVFIDREVALAKHLAEQTAFALAAKFGTPPPDPALLTAEHAD